MRGTHAGNDSSQTRSFPVKGLKRDIHPHWAKDIPKNKVNRSTLGSHAPLQFTDMRRARWQIIVEEGGRESGPEITAPEVLE